MPTTYAHYKFGKEVMSALPRPLQNAIENNRELFDIGLHGRISCFTTGRPLRTGSADRDMSFMRRWRMSFLNMRCR